jgi:hypothetical protein
MFEEHFINNIHEQYYKILMKKCMNIMNMKTCSFKLLIVYLQTNPEQNMHYL